MSPNIEDSKDGHFASGRIPGRFYVSGRFEYESPDSDSALDGTASRFAYQVLDADEDVVFEQDGGWEVRLRETPARQQLKALFFEDDRDIRRLAFQRFNQEQVPIARERFVLKDGEIEDLVGFLALIQSRALDLDEDPAGVTLLPQLVRSLLTEQSELSGLLAEAPEVLAELIRTDVSAPDVLALARRKQVLEEFHELLTNDDSFADERQRLRALGHRSGPEDVWQHLFESSPWILGVGAAPQFLHAWDPEKLEQTVAGRSIEGPGKRPDALMRTAGVLSSLTLVEIKHHRTELLRPDEYRAGCWAPSRELSGAVAQCQHTVDRAIHTLGRVAAITDDDGFEIDQAFVCRPRSILVVGHLGEFVHDEAVHRGRFESFERHRRSIVGPEIITFDELYDRARLALELASSP